MIDPKDFKAHISKLADDAITRAVERFGKEIPSLNHDLGGVRTAAAVRAHLLVKDMDEQSLINSFDHQILGEMALRIMMMAKDQHAKAGKHHSVRDLVQCIYHCRYHQVLLDIREMIRPTKYVQELGYTDHDAA